MAIKLNVKTVLQNPQIIQSFVLLASLMTVLAFVGYEVDYIDAQHSIYYVTVRNKSPKTVTIIESSGYVKDRYNHIIASAEISNAPLIIESGQKAVIEVPVFQMMSAEQVDAKYCSTCKFSIGFVFTYKIGDKIKEEQLNIVLTKAELIKAIEEGEHRFL